MIGSYENVQKHMNICKKHMKMCKKHMKMYKTHMKMFKTRMKMYNKHMNMYKKHMYFRKTCAQLFMRTIRGTFFHLVTWCFCCLLGNSGQLAAK